MKNVILIGIILFLISACRNEQSRVTSETESLRKIKKLEWLEGSWTNISEESQSYERWTRKNDSTFTSFSYTMVQEDTVFVEEVTLQERFKDVFLTVKVPDQNDAQAVTFKLIPTEKGIFTFENKAHDFPQRITYSNPVKDSIHAWIEGIVDGNPKKVDFLFKRVIE